jgi:ATP-dependent helicase/nuclease subunit A
VNKKPFIIYKSSAGSGKTYTLSKNYIRLALKRPGYFKRILAVTFTNKAAEEMKSRILEMVHAMSIGDEKELIIEFSKFYKISIEDVMDRAKKLESNILHNYSYFSITTIDTFFYSIIQSFTRDLKFRGIFNIEMDHELVINEVVENFISSIKKDSNLSKWLTEFSREKLREEKDFLIVQELKNMTKNLFSEGYKKVSGDLLIKTIEVMLIT